MPFGIQEAGSRGFEAGGDVTGARVLNAVYTNGGRRRLCFVALSYTTSPTAKGQAGYSATIGGSLHINPHAAGRPANRGDGVDFLFFVVDPGSDYSVTTDTDPGGSIAVDHWFEVDL